MKKKVLVLCTGNSCRSIMAEALINGELGECVEARSAGVEAIGKVNEQAKRLLEQEGLWQDYYHSKRLKEVMDEDFDLVVTVCDHAKEHCPVFPRKVKTIHVGFEDPSGKVFSEYKKTLELLKKRLLPIIKKELCDEKRGE